jgi:hypothetical protein
VLSDIPEEKKEWRGIEDSRRVENLFACGAEINDEKV